MEEPIKLSLLLNSKLNNFEKFFTFFYNTIEHKKPIIQPLHKMLYTIYDDIFNQKEFMININMPPRSGKTVTTTYFIAYSFWKNPKSRFIYVSYSAQVLQVVQTLLKKILQHPLYVLLSKVRINTELNEYIINNQKIISTKDIGKFTSKRIVLNSGGEVNFLTIGGAITGLGAGDGQSQDFSGAIIIDDANKPSDITSETMTQKTKNCFTNTLYSRYNRVHKRPPCIINIQQRLGLKDLTQYLEEDYKFKTYKIPLLDDKGNNTLPLTYSAEDITLLRNNEKVFLSQYQQIPVTYGTTLIDYKEFLFYTPDIYNLLFTNIVITTDYAFTDKEKSDSTCLCVWGYFKENNKPTKIYLLDMFCDKIKIQDKLNITKSFYKKWEHIENHWFIPTINAISIETNHNEDFLQLLEHEQLPVYQHVRRESKQTRGFTFMNSLHIMYDIYLPNDNTIIRKEYLEALKQQVLCATGDEKNHDDIVDNIMDAALIGLKFN